MATAVQTVPALLTLDEYRHTSYRPDVEFVDGHIEEKPMGTPKHGLLLAELCMWFGVHKKEWRIVIMGDVRTRTTRSRVRLPDVAVVTRESAELDGPWLTTPPLIAIEILSPDDRMKRMIVRLEEFRVLGVPHIWLFDPIARTAQIYTEAGLQPVDGPHLTLPDSPIYLDLPELFAGLD